MNRNSQSKSPKVLQLATIPMARRTVALLLAAGIAVGSSGLSAFAQSLDISGSGSKPVRGQIAISRDVNVTSSAEKVSLNLRDTSLRDVLNMLAQQGRFNLILDDSVSGNLTVDIKDISINKALEYIFTVADLSYTKDGNTVIVASKATAETKNLNAKTFKSIPVLYKDATSIANALNRTLFKIERPNGSKAALAAADADSNSLLIMGSESDIKLVGDALRELDVPRNRKVYSIRHSDPTRVMNLIAQNFFQNTGVSATAGGASGGSSASAPAAAASSAGAASGGTGTTAGATDNSPSTTFTGGGVYMIADPVSATLTVMATDEQLALIDSVIDQIDVRRPQVELEVSLLEVQNADLKTLVPFWSDVNVGNDGFIRLNGKDKDGNTTGINTFLLSRLGIPKHPGNVAFTTAYINQSHKTTRAKVLANPNIVAMDGTASTINITDQVPSVTQSTSIANGVTTIINTITTQPAGVTLTMTPKIFNDGSVVLNLQPTVSQPLATVKAGTASTVLISSRSLNLSGVRVKDGQTLVIGGLLKEHTSLDVDKVPGLSNLPIVRAMFNATNGDNRDRTELVLMVTPHILKEDAVSYFNGANRSKFNNPNQGSIQPVSLPKFIGPVSSSDFQQSGDAGKQGPERRIEMEKPAAGSDAGNDLKQSMLPPKEETMPLKPKTMETAEAFHLKLKPLAGRKAKKEAAPRLEAMDEVLKTDEAPAAGLPKAGDAVKLDEPPTKN